MFSKKSELYQSHLRDSTIHDVEVRKRDKVGRGHTGIKDDGKNKIKNKTKRDEIFRMSIMVRVY